MRFAHEYNGFFETAHSDHEILGFTPKWKQAPEPMNIMWECLEQSSLKLNLRLGAAFLFVVIVILSSAFLIKYLD